MTTVHPFHGPEDSEDESLLVDLPDPDTVVKGAMISDDALYRYFLTRIWDPKLSFLIFIMLNPSTATAELDDPTIRRCMGFARRDGYGGIIVINLFAFRATSPDRMKEADDPVGPENNDWLLKTLIYAQKAKSDVIAAWGVHGQHQDRDYRVAGFVKKHGVVLKCLGKTKGGDPRHPLYVKGDQPFVPLVDDDAGA